jgi:hypothetical protein
MTDPSPRPHDQHGDPSAPPPSPDDAARLHLEFCGEWHAVEAPGPFTLGREGDLSIDENPYLHRVFLALRWDRFWWLDNVGGTLAATVSDRDGVMHSFFAPGATLPLVFPVTDVRFTAGPTSYLLALHTEDAPLTLASTVVTGSGLTTMRPMALTTNQKQLVLALAEPALLASGTAASTIPSSAVAAERLGWTITKFNRQLDSVCQKLGKAGVRGLHGGGGGLATSRRARLVEYALATRLVSAEDLPLLDAAATT